MQICRSLAGYSYGRADLVRRAMAKKKADVMAKERQYFLYGKDDSDGTAACPGAVANGVSEQVANEIFDEMSSFAAYAFNKSHAAAYAYVAYQTAYLKCHYKHAYMASLLTSVLSNTDKVIQYIEACSEQGIRVLPPSINSSEVAFTVNGDALNFGLLAVKNLGRGAIEQIVAERSRGGAFSSLYDFLKRMQGKDVNKRAVEGLIKCGAFDGFSQNRKEMMASYEEMMDQVQEDARKNLEGQMMLFGSAEEPERAVPARRLQDYTVKEKLAMELESTGMYLSGHPLDEVVPFEGAVPIREIISEDASVRDGQRVCVLCIIQSKKQMSTKNKSVMAFLNIEDKTGVMEAILFPNVYERYKMISAPDCIVLIEGTISLKEDEKPKLICEKMIDYLSVSKKNDKNSLTQSSFDGKLYIKAVSRNDPAVLKMTELIHECPGQTPVCIYFADQKKSVTIKNAGVLLSDSLLIRLKKLFGDNNIVLR